MSEELEPDAWGIYCDGRILGVYLDELEADQRALSMSAKLGDKEVTVGPLYDCKGVGLIAESEASVRAGGYRAGLEAAVKRLEEAAARDSYFEEAAALVKALLEEKANGD